MVATARGERSQAEVLAGQARTALRQDGIEESDVTSLGLRGASPQGDVPAARQEVVRAQHVRPFAELREPHVAAQARIELTGVCPALAHMAGAEG
jgi:hypothetical protein